MTMDKWREEHIKEAIEKVQAIIDKGNGKESTCGCHREACQEVRLYLESWVLAPLKNSIVPTKSKRWQW